MRRVVAIVLIAVFLFSSVYVDESEAVAPAVVSALGSFIVGAGVNFLSDLAMEHVARHFYYNNIGNSRALIDEGGLSRLTVDEVISTGRIPPKGTKYAYRFKASALGGLVSAVAGLGTSILIDYVSDERLDVPDGVTVDGPVSGMATYLGRGEYVCDNCYYYSYFSGSDYSGYSFHADIPEGVECYFEFWRQTVENTVQSSVTIGTQHFDRLNSGSVPSGIRPVWWNEGGVQKTRVKFYYEYSDVDGKNYYTFTTYNQDGTERGTYSDETDNYLRVIMRTYFNPPGNAKAVYPIQCGYTLLGTNFSDEYRYMGEITSQIADAFIDLGAVQAAVNKASQGNERYVYVYVGDSDSDVKGYEITDSSGVQDTTVVWGDIDVVVSPEGVVTWSRTGEGVQIDSVAIIVNGIRKATGLSFPGSYTLTDVMVGQDYEVIVEFTSQLGTMQKTVLWRAGEGMVETGEINWDRLKNLGVAFTRKWPFSLPWDFVHIVSLLSADPVPPKFNVALPYPTVGGMQTIGGEIDMTKIEPVMKYVRWFEIASFCMCLVMVVRRLYGGSV